MINSIKFSFKLQLKLLQNTKAPPSRRATGKMAAVHREHVSIAKVKRRGAGNKNIPPRGNMAEKKEKPIKEA